MTIMRKLLLLFLFMYVAYIVTSCAVVLHSWNRSLDEINKWNKTFEGENK